MTTYQQQAQAWSAAGPVLPDELRLEVKDVLSQVRALVPLPVGPDTLDHASASRLVHHAWTALGAATEHAAGDAARRLLALVPALRLIELRLVDLHLQRSRSANRLLTRVLTRLEAVTPSVSAVVAAAPELVCELGFDRGMISRVVDGVWAPELMFIMGDPEWAAAITQAGKQEPQPLVPGLLETETVRTGRPFLATGIQDEPAKGHRAMIEASRTHSYVGAAIGPAGRVAGLLHADRFVQRRDVDEFDRDLLGAFADALCTVLSRAQLMDTLTAVQRGLTGATAVLEGAASRVHALPPLLLARSDHEDGDGVVVRTARRPPVSRPLPETLTRREHEVLGLMAAGRSNQAIAAELFIADGTVKQHVKHILRKLQAGNRSEAVARWFQSGPAADA